MINNNHMVQNSSAFISFIMIINNDYAEYMLNPDIRKCVYIFYNKKKKQTIYNNKVPRKIKPTNSIPVKSALKK